MEVSSYHSINTYESSKAQPFTKINLPVFNLRICRASSLHTFKIYLLQFSLCYSLQEPQLGTIHFFFMSQSLLQYINYHWTKCSLLEPIITRIIRFPNFATKYVTTCNIYLIYHLQCSPISITVILICPVKS